MTDILIHVDTRYGQYALVPDIPENILELISKRELDANFHYKRRFYKSGLLYYFDYFKYLLRLAHKPEFETMTCDVIIRNCPKHIQEQLKQNNYNFEVI